MNTKFVHESFELTADALNTVSGGRHHFRSRERLDSFAIQTLMSDYNQAGTLAASVQKKSDDTASGVIGKI